VTVADDRAPRIAVYTDALEIGGAEISAGHLVAHLPGEVSVVVSGVEAAVVDRVAHGRSTAATELVARPRGPWDVRAIANHARLFRRWRPDLIHLNLASPWACQHALVASTVLPRTPVVAVYQLSVPPVNRRQWMLKRLTSRRVTAHVAVGLAAAREIERVLGLRSGVVRTVYNAVPDREPPPPSLASRDGPTVVAVGRLEHQKGFDVLVDAFARVRGGRLLLVGDGGQRGALEQRVSRLGVGDRVQMTGWVENPRAILADADLFVLPSRFEGFPLAVVEAMLAGLPVVAADVGSVGEAVIDDETGLLVEPDDVDALAAALQRLLGDADQRGRLGRAGRRLALARFTPDRMARAYMELYRELVA
jgi:glycosyltransferase involved in cell wall biosynthesis